MDNPSELSLAVGSGRSQPPRPRRLKSCPQAPTTLYDFRHTAMDHLRNAPEQDIVLVDKLLHETLEGRT